VGDRGPRIWLALALTLCLTSAAEARPWAWLGVRIRDISEQEMESVAARHGVREGFGVVVVEVIEDTPASRAGIKSGDIVVALNGRPVTETRLLQRLITAAGANADVRLTVLRPEGRQPFTVRLTTMPAALAGDRVGIEFGFVLRESELQGDAGGARAPAGSPAVGAVIPGSAAVRAGLEVGDTILQINDTGVPTREAARDALAELDLDRPLRLVIRRGETQRAVTLSIAERG
jgi:S1-C subfamily serine protease